MWDFESSRGFPKFRMEFPGGIPSYVLLSEDGGDVKWNEISDRTYIGNLCV